jgi:hypothetical protein
MNLERALKRVKKYDNEIYECKKRIKYYEKKQDDLSEKLQRSNIILFDKDKHNSEKYNEACCCCLSHYKKHDAIRLLPCLHIVHYECFKKWSKNTCPICRTNKKKS